ncbi:MAG: hypothetical protein HY659_07385 [Rhizobiales bacterium]|nr:hypothetical protein [Hyphomicrobiales bacterium]
MSLSLPNVSVSSAANGAGIVIRYTFYAVGALVLGLIGLSILTISGYRVKQLDETPAFRLAAPELSRLPVKSNVFTSSGIGRMEVRQYGRIHDRDLDMTVVLTMPPKGAAIAPNFAREIRGIKPLQRANATFTSNYHDLETRFGPIRAAEMRVESDGQWKQCIVFVSRFATDAIQLAGWYCNASGARPNAHAVACILDRLTLESRLASAEADAFLRPQAARPAHCGATPVTQTTDTRARVPPPKRLR